MKNKVVYVITGYGCEVLNLPENTVIRVDEDWKVDRRCWEKSSLLNVVEEKSDRLAKNHIIVRDTRWIRKETENPTIHTIHGGYINQGCHILPSYSAQYLNELIKKSQP
jgi:hypothetical protein